MTFSQLPYTRADLAHWKSLVEDVTARFVAAKTFEEAVNECVDVMKEKLTRNKERKA